MAYRQNIIEPAEIGRAREINSGAIIDYPALFRGIRALLGNGGKESLVKPAHMFLSSLSYLEEGVPAYHDIRLRDYNGRVLLDKPFKDLDGEPTGLFDAEFDPVISPLGRLYHQSRAIKGSLGRLEDFMRSQRVLGCASDKKPTYLKYENTTCEFGTGGIDIVRDRNGRERSLSLFFEIDSDELKKSRNIFYDPEALGLFEEDRACFLVFGGIPFSAVRGLTLREEIE